MGDRRKTKKQLIEELESLRRQVSHREGPAGARHEDTPSEPSMTRPITRRTALANWIAPVILSIPLSGAVRPGAARAQGTSAPAFIPTQSPTSVPTEFPTFAPTGAPPTMIPTAAAPTPPAPTAAAPTVAAPTAAARQAAAVPVLGAAGLGVAAAALAGIGAKLLQRDGKAAPQDGGEKPAASDDDSGDKGGTK